jgi:bifunctional oligoribonuclease and PAP phosphatase NrnA
LDSRSIKKVKAVFEEPQAIVIITHKNPDGDAIGSSMALYHYLKNLGHNTTVVTPNDYPENLKWIPGHGKVLVFDKNVKKATAALKEAQIIFCLDFNSLKRIDEAGEIIAESKALKVVIDHHLEPDDFPDILFSDPSASSTAQMIYQFIEAMGDSDKITKDIANAVYMGIMTDTGSFRYSSVTAETHRVIARLIEAGAENAKIHENVWDTGTESKFRLLGYCLSEKMKIFEEFSAALITLTKDELQRFNYQKGDTEGFVNYPLAIDGIKMSAFFTDSEDFIRISFRSRGDFSVNEFAREHFEGGGHRNAAGGTSYLSMDETISKFISLLPQYRPRLNS